MKKFSTKFTFIDLFSGIGGFHVAASTLGMQCVFACEIDPDAKKMYQANFNLNPAGDILKIKPNDVPNHDFLFAGFPCQPFSIIGKKKGFSDPRGTLFFELLKIIKTKCPTGIVLENVKQLATADKGRILYRIVKELKELGYHVDYKILNALDFGLPQKRERIIIVATTDSLDRFTWPQSSLTKLPLSKILEKHPDKKHFVSDRIREKRQNMHTPRTMPSIWHENKSGNISSYPYSCALRAGASYNYLLVNGVRRLTPRETLRLQGFPDTYKIVCTESQVRKQTGNAVPVPMVKAVIQELIDVVKRNSVNK